MHKESKMIPIFLFSSQEHQPIPVDVRGHNGDAKYVWDGEGFALESTYGIKNNDFKRIERAIHKAERQEYEISTIGIHWIKLDEDVSFDSFTYEEAELSAFQRFFLEHPEINVAEFAKGIGLNPSLLRNYINGFKKPSKEREKLILDRIHELGRIYLDVAFAS